MAKFTCYKCGGSGQISAFSHIENGACFACSGSGQLSYQPKAKVQADPHPELLIPESERSTTKQWEYLSKLCDDSDRKICEIIRQAGGVMATQRYLNRKTMSKAIELARGI
jgi:hypothetical protein